MVFFTQITKDFDHSLARGVEESKVRVGQESQKNNGSISPPDRKVTTALLLLQSSFLLSRHRWGASCDVVLILRSRGQLVLDKTRAINFGIRIVSLLETGIDFLSRCFFQ